MRNWMMMSSIALLGRGHIGTYLKTALDIPDEDYYTGELADYHPPEREDVPGMVICTAAKTDLTWCQDNPIEAFRCNVEAHLTVFRRLDPRTAFVFLSSASVWDGPTKSGNAFTPNDEPEPLSVYSWTKAAIDAMLLREAKGRMLAILRPHQVYSPLPFMHNMITRFITYERFITMANSMTSAETIARTIRAIQREPRHCLDGRVICVYDRGVSSPLIAATVLYELGMRSKPEMMTQAELDRISKPRRPNVVMYDWWFEDVVGPPDLHGDKRGEFYHVAVRYKENMEKAKNED